MRLYFFFKQKTAYDMRISDWSSDVCSSDLANAPAMQLAHRSHVIDMLDGAEIRRVIELEQPDLIVPEIEAIHTPTLQALEREGHTVIPTERAAWLTMDREGIRRLAAEALGLPTSSYRFAGTFDAYRPAV